MLVLPSKDFTDVKVRLRKDSSNGSELRSVRARDGGLDKNKIKQFVQCMLAAEDDMQREDCLDLLEVCRALHVSHGG